MVKQPLVPIPEGFVDFTKRIRNVSVRYLTTQKPTGRDLDKWIVVPLYQFGQDMPLDNDGKTALLVANVKVLRQILMDYDKKLEKEEEEERKKKEDKRKNDTTSDGIVLNSDVVQEAKKYLGLSSDDDEEEKYGKMMRMNDYGADNGAIPSTSKESHQSNSVISVGGIEDFARLREQYGGDKSE